jgi:hypothetical protein
MERCRTVTGYYAQEGKQIGLSTFLLFYQKGLEAESFNGDKSLEGSKIITQRLLKMISEIPLKAVNKTESINLSVRQDPRFELVQSELVTLIR